MRHTYNMNIYDTIHQAYFVYYDSSYLGLLILMIIYERAECYNGLFEVNTMVKLKRTCIERRSPNCHKFLEVFSQLITFYHKIDEFQ